MEPSRILAVDHVNLEAPLGVEDALRWFYGEVAELEEVLCDGVDPPRLCFKSGQTEIRIHLSDRPHIESIALRLTVSVPALPGVIERLDERGARYQRLSGIMYTDRVLQTLDPAGNRVALKQGWPELTL